MHDIYIYIYYHIFVASWVVSCYLLPTKTRKIHWTTFAEVPLIYMIVTRHWEALESQRGRLCPNTGTCVWFVFWFCTHSFVCKNMWFSMNARVLVGNKKIIISEMDSLWLFRWFFSSSFVFKLAMFRLEIRVEAQFLTWLVGKTKAT